MRTITLIAVATMLAAPAFGQTPGTTGAGPAPVKPVAAAPAGAANPAVHALKPAPASTPESRSAAALALSHEPTFDEGTARRIRMRR